MEASNNAQKPQQAEVSAANEQAQPQQPEPRKWETPSQQERYLDGCRGRLWTIEIIYTAGYHEQEVKKHDCPNLYWQEVEEFRYNVFQIGFRIKLAPGRFRLVPPMNIVDITIERQAVYRDIKHM